MWGKMCGHGVNVRTTLISGVNVRTTLISGVNVRTTLISGVKCADNAYNVG
jgi:hypothetical protein